MELGAKPIWHPRRVLLSSRSLVDSAHIRPLGLDLPMFWLLIARTLQYLIVSSYMLLRHMFIYLIIYFVTVIFVIYSVYGMRITVLRIYESTAFG